MARGVLLPGNPRAAQNRYCARIRSALRTVRPFGSCSIVGSRFYGRVLYLQPRYIFASLMLVIAGLDRQE